MLGLPLVSGAVADDAPAPAPATLTSTTPGAVTAPAPAPDAPDADAADIPLPPATIPDPGPAVEGPAKPAEPPEPADPFGIRAAEARLGRDVPVGRKIVAGHVEGNNGEYLPDWNNKGFGKVLFVRRSGESKPFGHTTATASVLYGPGGLAPGISVVHFFSSQHWLTKGYLNAGTKDAPKDDLPRVWSHSWIGGMGPNSGAEHALARVDWQIDQRDVVMCVGVNNGRENGVPALLASAYNVIAVGVSNGNSSGGYTKLAGAGRCKPDIVAPRELTSYATPVVAAVAARMLEAAGKISPGQSRSASQSETIKALILVGATKPEKWAPEPGKPLDEHLGAGNVHLDQSLRVLEAGEQPPGPISLTGGWDHRPLAQNARSHYRFTLDAPVRNASIMLVWNRRATAVTAENSKDQSVWVPVPRMADFDLRLVRVGEAGVDTVAMSASAVDNVEHVFERELPAGDYAIEVRRQNDGQDEPWDYALAWRCDDERVE